MTESAPRPASTEPADDSSPGPAEPEPEPEPAAGSTEPSEVAESSGAAQPEAAAARRSGGRVRAWLIGAGLGLVAVGGMTTAAVATVAIVEHLQGDATRAEIGDCLDDADAPERLRRVDCDHADAAWTVAHRAEAVPEAEFSDATRREELCHPAGEWELAFWLAKEQSALGDVMCLQPR